MLIAIFPMLHLHVSTEHTVTEWYRTSLPTVQRTKCYWQSERNVYCCRHRPNLHNMWIIWWWIRVYYGVCVCCAVQCMLLILNYRWCFCVFYLHLMQLMLLWNIPKLNSYLEVYFGSSKILFKQKMSMLSCSDLLLFLFESDDHNCCQTLNKQVGDRICTKEERRIWFSFTWRLLHVFLFGD